MRATKPRASHRRPPRRHPLLTLAAVGSVALAGAASTRAHVVGAGETLSEIGADHGVTVSELAEANGIDDIDRIVAGESLTIPDPDGTRDEGDGGGGSSGGGGGGNGKADDAKGEASGGEASGGEASGGEAHEARFHTVAAGDTLSGLARTYGVSVRDLAEANGIVDIHHIRIGDRLDVSGSVRSAGTGGGSSSQVDVSRFPARLQASPERLALVPVFERWAATYGVPLDLLMAMTWLESGWQHDVVSSAGAIGIGQLMPDTVTWMEDVLIGEPLDPYDPDDNIRMSARYLRWLLDRTGGDAATALAGYYQGLGAVQTSGIFPSTRAYVADVLAFRDRYF